MTAYLPFVERAFNQNDWFVVIMCLLLIGIIFFLPKRFTRPVTCLLLLYSVTVATILDNTIAAHLFDFYDIMDGPAYTFMDLVVYLLYAPFGYFFIYIYDRFQLTGRKAVIYVLLFSLFSLAFEWLCVRFGVFHYKMGYGMYYSYCIYLFVQTLTIFFYRYIALS